GPWLFVGRGSRRERDARVLDAARGDVVRCADHDGGPVGDVDSQRRKCQHANVDGDHLDGGPRRRPAEDQAARGGTRTFSTTEIYIREAEAVREGFGEVFPAGAPDRSLGDRCARSDAGPALPELLAARAWQ